MHDYSFRHLSNDVAWNSYVAAESHEVADTAMTLALLADVDERKLYLPAGYGSMCDFCMRARRMTKDRALKRIRVARAGREFPAIFPAIAEGRLGVSAVLLLVPHLTQETRGGTHLGREPQDQRGDRAVIGGALPADRPADAASAGRDRYRDRPSGRTATSPIAMSNLQHFRWNQFQWHPQRNTPGGATPTAQRGRRSWSTCDRCSRTRGRAPASSRCWTWRWIASRTSWRQQKFGKCSRPGKARGSKNPRHVPREVRREVWARDGGQCTFTASDGTRCAAQCAARI